MHESYRAYEEWILPETGAWGEKARNLLENAACIKSWGLFIPHSMAIPYTYYQQQRGIFYLIDDIQEVFGKEGKVVVRSNAPSEDAFGREPGLYHSEEIDLSNRHEALSGIESVLSSYQNEMAQRLRREQGIPEQGMCLLVQEKINARLGGCFSDIGEYALLTFVDTSKGVKSMSAPFLFQHRVDSNGAIADKQMTNEYNKYIAQKLSDLRNSLPRTIPYGWEIEFLANEERMYVVQTTPIEKKSPFRVERTPDNVFVPLNNISVLGTGKFVCSNVLYLLDAVMDDDCARIVEFEKTHKDYCIVTDHVNVHYANKFRLESQFEDHIFRYAFEYTVLIDVVEQIQMMQSSLAAHVQQALRQGKAVLAGNFKPEFHNLLSVASKNNNSHSPTTLEIQADECKQMVNVRMIGDLQQFTRL